MDLSASRLGRRGWQDDSKVTGVGSTFDFYEADSMDNNTNLDWCTGEAWTKR